MLRARALYPMAWLGDGPNRGAAAAEGSARRWGMEETMSAAPAVPALITGYLVSGGDLQSNAFKSGTANRTS